MSNALPSAAEYVVVGAGIHGLSTAWHLAMELESRGSGSGVDIVVLDKTGPGAGASGIGCGCEDRGRPRRALHRPPEDRT